MGTLSTPRVYHSVQLLVMIIAIVVLLSVALPGYRKSAAGRACKANIAAIGAASSVFVMYNGQYPYAVRLMNDYNMAHPLRGGIVGAPGGIPYPLACPLDGAPYRALGGGPRRGLVIYCPHCCRQLGGDGMHDNAATSRAAGLDSYATALVPPAEEYLP